MLCALCFKCTGHQELMVSVVFPCCLRTVSPPPPYIRLQSGNRLGGEGPDQVRQGQLSPSCSLAPCGPHSFCSSVVFLLPWPVVLGPSTPHTLPSAGGGGGFFPREGQGGGRGGCISHWAWRMGVGGGRRGGGGGFLSWKVRAGAEVCASHSTHG